MLNLKKIKSIVLETIVFSIVVSMMMVSLTLSAFVNFGSSPLVLTAVAFAIAMYTSFLVFYFAIYLGKALSDEVHFKGWE